MSGESRCVVISQKTVKSEDFARTNSAEIIHCNGVHHVTRENQNRSGIHRLRDHQDERDDPLFVRDPMHERSDTDGTITNNRDRSMR